jgi:hypothetical protein
MSKSKLTNSDEDPIDKIEFEKINEAPLDEKQFYRGDKKLLKDGALFEWTPKMIKENKTCAEDIIHFAENHFYIIDPNKGKKSVIELYVRQKQILRSLQNNRFVSVLSCRQAGKTTLMTIFALWLTIFHSDQRVVIVANNENTAIRVLKRIRMAYEQLEPFIKPGLKEYGKTGITFSNDSSIGVSTTTSTAARGDTASCLIIDEAAFIDQNFIDDFWKSVIPIITRNKKSKIFMTSTPNGTDNKFYEIYSGAEKNVNGWKAERIDWWDIPGQTEKWKKDMIAALGSEEYFKQEFENHFVSSGEGAVAAETIEKLKNERVQPLWVNSDVAYKIFTPPDKDKLYVIGVDVGEGIGRASSVAQVLDITDPKNIQQVAVYCTNTLDPFHFGNKIFAIANSWGKPPLLIERNNCGGQVIDALYYTLQYERIVTYTKTSNKGSYVSTRNLGMLSHNNLRSDAISNMRYWVNSLRAVHIHDIDTILEFETFVKQSNGVYKKRNERFHDDRVMALVWALMALSPELCQQIFSIIEYDSQGMPLIIEDNGDWAKDITTYIPRDIDTNSVISIVQPYIDEKANRRNSSILDDDKYDEKFNDDIYDLMSDGYTFL